MPLVTRFQDFYRDNFILFQDFFLLAVLCHRMRLGRGKAEIKYSTRIFPVFSDFHFSRLVARQKSLLARGVYRDDQNTANERARRFSKHRALFHSNRCGLQHPCKSLLQICPEEALHPVPGNDVHLIVEIRMRRSGFQSTVRPIRRLTPQTTDRGRADDLHEEEDLQKKISSAQPFCQLLFLRVVNIDWRGSTAPGQARAAARPGPIPSSGRAMPSAAR